MANEILCLTPEFIEKKGDEIIARWNSHDHLIAALIKIQTISAHMASKRSFELNKIATDALQEAGAQ